MTFNLSRRSVLAGTDALPFPLPPRLQPFCAMAMRARRPPARTCSIKNCRT